MKTLRYFSLIILSLSLLVLASCTPDTTTPDPNPNTSGDYPDADFGVDKQKLLDLVNAKRASGCNCGTETMPPVPALTWNNRLATAALKHSQDMNAKNYFAHDSKDGRDPGDRITAEGYTWMAYGENIAKGQTTEQEVFDAWMNSPGHCKNIMGANFKEMGLGRAANYWTQDFGKK